MQPYYHHAHHNVFVGSQFKNMSKSDLQVFERVRQHLISEDGAFDDFLKCLLCYMDGVFNQYELLSLVAPLFQNEDLFSQFKNVVAVRDVSRRSHNLLLQPLSELESHGFEKLSYSYFKMP